MLNCNNGFLCVIMKNNRREKRINIQDKYKLISHLSKTDKRYVTNKITVRTIFIYNFSIGYYTRIRGLLGTKRLPSVPIDVTRSRRYTLP